MMEDGGPAFPTPGDYTTHRTMGMSMRDWMAGLAMQGMLASLPESDHPGFIRGIDGQVAGGLARVSYTIADAMLKARSRSGT